MQTIDFFDFERSVALEGGYLVTVNLQHLYECSRNEALRQVFFADPRVRLCLDGRGAHILFQRLLGATLPLAAGNEVLAAHLAAGKCRRVLVIGTNETVLAEIAKRYPALTIVQDSRRFPALDDHSASEAAAEIIAKVGSDFDTIAVALGVPKQEVLAQALSARLPHLPILCVGGSFEMIAGHLTRAPRFLQRLGLEGVWRLIRQPSRARLQRAFLSYWNFVRFYLDSRDLEKVVGFSAHVRPLKTRP